MATSTPIDKTRRVADILFASALKAILRRNEYKLLSDEDATAVSTIPSSRFKHLVSTGDIGTLRTIIVDRASRVPNLQCFVMIVKYGAVLQLVMEHADGTSDKACIELDGCRRHSLRTDILIVDEALK